MNEDHRHEILESLLVNQKIKFVAKLRKRVQIAKDFKVGDHVVKLFKK